MELKDMIGRRKSVRSYTNEPVDEETLREIEAFIAEIKPLEPDIRVAWEIVPASRVKCILPWKAPQLVAIYAEDKEGALENAGFLFQQLDLYLQGRGLGACWLGMGRPDQQLVAKDGLPFCMLLAFGYPKGETLRENANEFKRKALADIADEPDKRLEPARLAPSSVNSQPWYFTHEEGVIHVWRVKPSGLMRRAMERMNRIDMGIALAHLSVSHEGFRYFRSERPMERKGYCYTGSVTL